MVERQARVYRHTIVLNALCGDEEIEADPRKGMQAVEQPGAWVVTDWTTNAERSFPLTSIRCVTRTPVLATQFQDADGSWVVKQEVVGADPR